MTSSYDVPLRDVKSSSKPWKVITVNRRYRHIKIVEKEFRYRWAADFWCWQIENFGGGYHPSFAREVVFSQQEPKR